MLNLRMRGVRDSVLEHTVFHSVDRKMGFGPLKTYPAGDFVAVDNGDGAWIGQIVAHLEVGTAEPLAHAVHISMA